MTEIIEVDVNGDGIDDVVEVREFADGAVLSIADTNGDGMADMAAYDADGDGVIEAGVIDNDYDGQIDERYVASEDGSYATV